MHAICTDYDEVRVSYEIIERCFWECVSVEVRIFILQDQADMFWDSFLILCWVIWQCCYLECRWWNKTELTWEVWIGCIQYSLNNSLLYHCVLSALSRHGNKAYNGTEWVDIYVKLQKWPNEVIEMLKTVHGESIDQRNHGCQSSVFLCNRFVCRKWEWGREWLRKYKIAQWQFTFTVYMQVHAQTCMWGHNTHLVKKWTVFQV
jgi:hypothetical protein